MQAPANAQHYFFGDFTYSKTIKNVKGKLKFFKNIATVIRAIIPNQKNVK